MKEDDSYKIVTVRLKENTIDNIMKIGKVERFSKKLQIILDEYIKEEYMRQTHWLIFPKELVKILFAHLDESGIEMYSNQLIVELEKIRMFNESSKTLLDIFLQIDSLWHDKNGTLYKMVKENDVITILSEHNLGENVSKVKFNVYKKLAEKENLEICNVVISETHLNFEICHDCNCDKEGK